MDTLVIRLPSVIFRHDPYRWIMPRPAAEKLQLTITATTGKALVPFLRKHLRAAHAILKPSLSELSLALVGDATMSDLHQRFMNIAGPTDVLTFPLDDD